MVSRSPIKAEAVACGDGGAPLRRADGVAGPEGAPGPEGARSPWPLRGVWWAAWTVTQTAAAAATVKRMRAAVDRAPAVRRGLGGCGGQVM